MFLSFLSKARLPDDDKPSFHSAVSSQRSQLPTLHKTITAEHIKRLNAIHSTSYKLTLINFNFSCKTKRNGHPALCEPIPLYLCIYVYNYTVFDRNFQEESKMKPVEFPC